MGFRAGGWLGWPSTDPKMGYGHFGWLPYGGERIRKPGARGNESGPTGLDGSEVIQ